MLADPLRFLDLRILTISSQETDAFTLLNFPQRLHCLQRRQPSIVLVQLNVFLPRNDPASEIATTSGEGQEAERAPRETTSLSRSRRTRRTMTMKTKMKTKRRAISPFGLTLFGATVWPTSHR